MSSPRDWSRRAGFASYTHIPNSSPTGAPRSNATASSTSSGSNVSSPLFRSLHGQLGRGGAANGVNGSGSSQRASPISPLISPRRSNASGPFARSSDAEGLEVRSSAHSLGHSGLLSAGEEAGAVPADSPLFYGGYAAEKAAAAEPPAGSRRLSSRPEHSPPQMAGSISSNGAIAHEAELPSSAAQTVLMEEISARQLLESCMLDSPPASSTPSRTAAAATAGNDAAGSGSSPQPPEFQGLMSPRSISSEQQPPGVYSASAPQSPASRLAVAGSTPAASPEPVTRSSSSVLPSPMLPESHVDVRASAEALRHWLTMDAVGVLPDDLAGNVAGLESLLDGTLPLSPASPEPLPLRAAHPSQSRGQPPSPGRPGPGYEPSLPTHPLSNSPMRTPSRTPPLSPSPRPLLQGRTSFSHPQGSQQLQPPSPGAAASPNAAAAGALGTPPGSAAEPRTSELSDLRRIAARLEELTTPVKFELPVEPASSGAASLQRSPRPFAAGSPSVAVARASQDSSGSQGQVTSGLSVQSSRTSALPAVKEIPTAALRTSSPHGDAPRAAAAAWQRAPFRASSSFQSPTSSETSNSRLHGNSPFKRTASSGLISSPTKRVAYSQASKQSHTAAVNKEASSQQRFARSPPPDGVENQAAAPQDSFAIPATASSPNTYASLSKKMSSLELQGSVNKSYMRRTTPSPCRKATCAAHDPASSSSPSPRYGIDSLFYESPLRQRKRTPSPHPPNPGPSAEATYGSEADRETGMSGQGGLPPELGEMLREVIQEHEDEAAFELEQERARDVVYALPCSATEISYHQMHNYKLTPDGFRQVVLEVPDGVHRSPHGLSPLRGAAMFEPLVAAPMSPEFPRSPGRRRPRPPPASVRRGGAAQRSSSSPPQLQEQASVTSPRRQASPDSARTPWAGNSANAAAQAANDAAAGASQPQASPAPLPSEAAAAAAQDGQPSTARFAAVAEGASTPEQQPQAHQQTPEPRTPASPFHQHLRSSSRLASPSGRFSPSFHARSIHSPLLKPAR